MRSKSSHGRSRARAGPRRSRRRGPPRPRGRPPRPPHRRRRRRVDQVRLARARPARRAPSRRARARVDDPGDRAVVARVEQLAHDRATQSPGATGHEHAHNRGRLTRPSPALPWQVPWSRPRSTPSRCFVRDLADGQEVDEVFVVRGPHAAPEAQRRALPEAPARRHHRRRRGRDLGRGRGRWPRSARPARSSASSAATRSTSATARPSRSSACGSPPRTSTSWPTSPRPRRSPTSRWPPISRRWSRRSSGHTCARCWSG